jgi:hypothetical protein
MCPGIAVLVDDPSAHHDPSQSALKVWKDARLNDVRQQIALTEEKGSIEASNPDRAMSENAKRKRKEREERRARAKSNITPSVPAEHSPSPHPTSENPSQTVIGETPDNDIVMPSGSYTVNIPASSSKLEWYAPSSNASLTIARETGIWLYPSTLQERARCGVFRDLWEKGYYMGGGIKFGGEYLVYPGMFSFLFEDPPAPSPTPVLESVLISNVSSICANLRYSSHQVTPSVIIHTLSHRSSRLRTPLSAQWKLSHMAVWAPGQRRRICCVNGMMKHKLYHIYLSNGQDLDET